MTPKPAAHTPTPWKMKHNGLNAYIVGGPDKFPCGNMPGQGITNEANAAFIVRAVNAHEELLEACKCAGDALLANEGDPIKREALRQLREAIARAEVL